MKKIISYVLPIYNEEKNIKKFYDSLVKTIGKETKYNFELIFINDGSKDESLKILEEFAKNDKSTCIINLSRNFGHQAAITAGLDHASGDAVIIMDTDLQDPPSVSIELVKKWEEGFDVVYAQRKSRQDTFFKKVTADAYYRLLEKTATISIPRNTGDFRLMDRAVVLELRKFREQNRFMRGLVSYLGFSQVGVQFDRHARYAGETGYPIKKMVKFAIDGILSFSTAPIKLINAIGSIAALVSFIAIAIIGAVKLLNPSSLVPGWTFIVISIFFMGGVQLLMMGVLGSYIGRTYSEVQNRPIYIIKNSTNIIENKSS